MLLSAEMRWFWKDICPAGVEAWFRRGGEEPGGGRTGRRDRYFVQDGSLELGLKVRDEQRGPAAVEIKALISEISHLSAELWGKWKSTSLPQGPSIVVEKQRWLRKLSLDGPAWEIPLGADETPLKSGDRPRVGCNLELTRVIVEERSDIWWTLGFEAFGHLLEAPIALGRAIDIFRPPALTGEKANYPQWLAALGAGSAREIGTS